MADIPAEHVGERPDDPQEGDVWVSHNGDIYRWDGTQWIGRYGVPYAPGS